MVTPPKKTKNKNKTKTKQNKKTTTKNPKQTKQTNKKQNKTKTKQNKKQIKQKQKQQQQQTNKPEQADFRVGCSTYDHLQTVSYLTERSNDFNIPLCIGYIDYEKAYDCNEHKAI